MTNTIVSDEWPTLPQFRVVVLLDRWDGDSDRIVRLYRAFGKLDARTQAQFDYPDGSVLSVERIDSPSAGTLSAAATPSGERAEPSVSADLPSAMTSPDGATP